MRCVVTGAAGFIGSTLTERLLADGHEVTGVDCFSDYYPRPIKERNLATARDHAAFKFHEIDLAQAPLEELIASADVIYHQAAQAGVRASWGKSFDVYTRHNLTATQRILETMLDQKSQARLVYASTSSVYGETPDLPMRETSRPRPYSPYGVTKLAAENLLELYRHNFGLSTVALRYFTVYGPRQRPDMGFHRFIKRLLGGEPLPIYGDGEQTRDFTFVDDVVAANLLAAKPGCEGIYNIGGGSRVTLNEVLELLGELVGAPVTVSREGKQPGDVRHTAADTSLAQAQLGFAPTVDLREGLTRQVAWMRTLPA